LKRADNPGALIAGVLCSRHLTDSHVSRQSQAFMQKIFPPTETQKVLVNAPDNDERQAFFEQMRTTCVLPPPISVTAKDLRDGIPIASDSVIPAPPESTLELQRERLKKERADGAQARVTLRYELRNLLERIIDSRSNPASMVFGSAETLEKRLGEEPKAVRAKALKHAGENGLIFFSDIREKDEHFATVQNFAEAINAVKDTLSAYLKQHASAPADLIGKLGLTFDYCTRELHQLSPDMCARSTELWQRQQGQLESWIASLQPGSCPCCGLADFEGETLRCSKKGCQYPIWHRDCLMSSPPAKPSQWVCPLCVAEALKAEKASKAPAKGAKGSKKDDTPAEPMKHKELPVTGVEPLKALTASAVKTTTGMTVGELDKLWGEVSAFVFKHQQSTDKSALVSAITPILQKPRQNLSRTPY